MNRKERRTFLEETRVISVSEELLFRFELNVFVSIKAATCQHNQLYKKSHRSSELTDGKDSNKMDDVVGGENVGGAELNRDKQRR